jgi:hypothetical protein
VCELLWWYGVLFSFLKNNEWLALWVEGIALLLIFIYDRKDAKDQHKETLEQHAIWRRQVHADRVAGIFQAMRTFLFVVSDGIQNDSFGVGQRFEYHTSAADDPYDEAYPMKEFVAIHEAHHLAILINESLAAYVGERVKEAVALQGVNDHEEFNKRLDIFWKNWEGKKMAEAMRKLS